MKRTGFRCLPGDELCGAIKPKVRYAYMQRKEETRSYRRAAAAAAPSGLFCIKIISRINVFISTPGTPHRASCSRSRAPRIRAMRD